MFENFTLQSGNTALTLYFNLSNPLRSIAIKSNMWAATSIIPLAF